MDIYSVTTSEVLDRISRHCPEALSAYLQCLHRADQSGSVYFSKHQIEVDLSEDLRPFTQKIKKLARENLLQWHPFDNGISVTLADIEHDV